MKFRPRLKLFFFTFLLILNYLNGFSTVMGPVEIDILGFDSSSNSIYFTRTDWGEFDSHTSLYTYRIDIDSVEIISDWISRTDYSRKKDEIIKNKGFSNLAKPDTAVQPDFVLFNWEPAVQYYSKIRLAETISLPFTISVFGKIYNYYQCSEKSGEPKIVNLKIDEDSGLIMIKFQGDCYEGNWKDSLIYYSKKSGILFSKKLTSNDVMSLDFFKMENK